MPTAIVEHLEHGLTVRCADGTEITCAPLMLQDAMEIMNHTTVLADKTAQPEDRVQARMAIVRRFAERYPDLLAHVSAGDVEMLVPDFFWSTTGAAPVARNGGLPTGTSSLPSTARPGA